MEENPDRPGLAEEAEAFLTGRYRHMLDASHLDVPAWAWVNELARGDRQTLLLSAHMSTADRCDPGRLIATIAARMLVLGEAEFRALQWRTLMPLEEMLNEIGGDVPRREEDLARALAAALVRMKEERR